jgi:hypothetical protein
MQVYDAWRAPPGPYSQRPPQEKVVKGGFPLLTFNHVDIFVLNEPFDEKCRVPGKPLVRKRGFLEASELARGTAREVPPVRLQGIVRTNAGVTCPISRPVLSIGDRLLMHAAATVAARWTAATVKVQFPVVTHPSPEKSG